MKWYLKAFSQYAVFQGRARRKEYWMFFICNYIVTAILGGVSSLIASNASSPVLIAGAVSGIYALIIFLPSLAVSIRRMHDIGKSGTWLLISLIPLIGTIWYFLLTCKSGNYGDNIYGPDPKR